ncbi:HEPN domain-containing protein [Peribacillus sp. FSL K6-5616]|uniref:HEPN domain-containing protein n=1 Tax=Peribacillus TaxID=2675229 RepID=UPI0030F5DB4F
MIIGLMKYKNKNCVFKLKDFTLEIEEIENRDSIYIDDLDFLFNDTKSKKDVPNVLKGNDFENGNQIHFSIVSINQTGAKTHSASLHSYILYEKEETAFDGVQINSDELNWFHNVKQSYSFTIAPDSGQSEVRIEPYKNTEKRFKFNFENQVIQVNLNVSRNFSFISTMPIRLQTDMNFYFEPTNEFNFVERLINVSNRFLKFITYRKNTTFKPIILKKKIEETGKYQKVGKLYINEINTERSEEEKLIQDRLIDLPLIEDNLGKLFERLAENTIYISHIPENSVENSRITTSRFIMATAGFEWQFRSFYNEISNRSEDKYKEQKEEILAFLDERIEQNTGKRKKYFKSYKNLLLKSDLTLSDKINWALSEFNDVLEVFINPIYSWNGLTDVKYTEISERIQTQRNNIAHGNIDKEFNSIVILDLLVLEWLYYAMVLSDVGVSREKIRLAINKLFNRRIAL